MDPTAVAMTSIIATASTAIAALVIQVVLYRAGTTREAKKARYQELVAIYSDVGRAMSSATWIFNRLATVQEDGTLTGSIEQTEVTKEFEEISRQQEPRHMMKMLRFHAASPKVLDAVKAWQERMDEPLPEDEKNSLADDWTAKVKAVESALKDYYMAAGEDARAQSGVRLRP